MVRRVGFNEPKNSEPPEIGADAAQRLETAASKPAVRRNWTRIVFQIFWVDAWIIAGFTFGQDIFRSVLSGDEAVAVDQLLLLSIVFLGGLISVRKLIRLLRGEPVVASS